MGLVSKFLLMETNFEETTNWVNQVEKVDMIGLMGVGMKDNLQKDIEMAKVL